MLVQADDLRAVPLQPRELFTQRTLLRDEFGDCVAVDGRERLRQAINCGLKFGLVEGGANGGANGGGSAFTRQAQKAPLMAKNAGRARLDSNQRPAA